MKDYTGEVPITRESFNEDNDIALFMGPIEAMCDRIEVEGLKSLMQGDGKFAIIDIRPPDEYMRGHICGAADVPIDAIEERFQSVDPAKQVIVYGGTPSGAEGAVAADKLHTLSFRNVLVLEGGIQAWRHSGGCVEFEAHTTIN